jgi:hypothetical protein
MWQVDEVNAERYADRVADVGLVREGGLVHKYARLDLPTHHHAIAEDAVAPNPRAGSHDAVLAHDRRSAHRRKRVHHRVLSDIYIT